MVQELINGIAGLATLEAVQPLGWQRPSESTSGPGRIRQADLCKALSARILALTGRHISPEEIYADVHLAVAGVDGMTFRLYRSSLVLVRTCAYCDTGCFERPKISNLSDLGYALTA